LGQGSSLLARQRRRCVIWRAAASAPWSLQPRLGLGDGLGRGVSLRHQHRCKSRTARGRRAHRVRKSAAAGERRQPTSLVSSNRGERCGVRRLKTAASSHDPRDLLAYPVTTGEGTRPAIDRRRRDEARRLGGHAKGRAALLVGKCFLSRCSELNDPLRGLIGARAASSPSTMQDWGLGRSRRTRAPSATPDVAHGWRAGPLCPNAPSFPRQLLAEQILRRARILKVDPSAR